MRYRLRTLLIVMTLVCAYLAWVAYCRREAACHREQSSVLITVVAKREGRDRKWIEGAVREYFNYYGEPDNSNFEPVYRSAVNHERMARKYDRAAWFPWVLISD